VDAPRSKARVVLQEIVGAAIYCGAGLFIFGFDWWPLLLWILGGAWLSWILFRMGRFANLSASLLP
jgi:hypothetical protein